MKKLLIIGFLFFSTHSVFSQNKACSDTLIVQEYKASQFPYSTGNEILIIQSEDLYKDVFGGKPKIDFSKTMIIAFYIREIGKIYDTEFEIICDSINPVKIIYTLNGPAGARKQYINCSSSYYYINKIDLENAQFIIRYIDKQEATANYKNTYSIILEKHYNEYWLKRNDPSSR